jgi:hypothetical protein
MKMQQYSDIAASTAFYPGCDTGGVDAVTYCAIGLGGEVGELQNKLKKFLRDEQQGLAITENYAGAMLDEAGDVLWYLDRLVYELGSTLAEVADANLGKLLTRQVNGTLAGSGDHR